MSDSYHWVDVDRIAEELADAFPDRDPYSVRFTELRELVRSLRGFHEIPGHPVNEKILEAIQSAWADEQAGLSRDEPD